MSDFIQQQQRSQARDIIGLLQATETLLARITLSPQDALALSIRVANLCAGVEKEAQRMASRCGEKAATGGP